MQAVPREARVDPARLRQAYERIQERIEYDTNGGCWLWPGGLAGTYGVIRIRPYGSSFAVHRVAYWVERGPIPEGLQGCHSCDVRECCNPFHVFPGTQSDNLQDASRKGRLYLNRHNREFVGERHPAATLSNADVQAIRILHAKGFNAPYLAQRFGTSEGNVFKIAHGRARLRG